jgi:hypothetical protein
MPASPQDLATGLRALANHWAVLARDYARDGKSVEASDPARSNYLRGVADGYYKAATELAGHLKQAETRSGAPGQAPEAPVAAIPVGKYAHVDMNDVLSMFALAGTAPRDVFPRENGTYTAVFSKWEPMQPHERVAALQRVDPRVVILGQGKSKDAGDPTIDFAFKG